MEARLAAVLRCTGALWRTVVLRDNSGQSQFGGTVVVLRDKYRKEIVIPQIKL